jgi:hypothetical protein
MYEEQPAHGGGPGVSAEVRRLIADLADALADELAQLHRERSRLLANVRALAARGDSTGLSVKRDVSAYDHLLSAN